MGTTSVADPVFSKVQQRVLAVLFGNPDRSFDGRQVIALAGSGSGAVPRELARLVQAGLATVTPIGRQTHYQANPASPVFAELRSLVLERSGLAEVLRDALAAFAHELRAALATLAPLS